MSKRVVPAQLAHLDLLELRQHEAEEFAQPGGKDRLVNLILGACGAVTLIYDGRIVAILGFFEHWPGLIEVYLIPSKWASQYAILFAKEAYRYIKALEASQKPYRIQSASVADAFHDRWMQFLGLEPEGLLKSYSPSGHDYRMWAKTWGQTSQT